MGSACARRHNTLPLLGFHDIATGEEHNENVTEYNPAYIKFGGFGIATCLTGSKPDYHEQDAHPSRSHTSSMEECCLIMLQCKFNNRPSGKLVPGTTCIKGSLPLWGRDATTCFAPKGQRAKTNLLAQGLSTLACDVQQAIATPYPIASSLKAS